MFTEFIKNYLIGRFEKLVNLPSAIFLKSVNLSIVFFLYLLHSFGGQHSITFCGGQHSMTFCETVFTVFVRTENVALFGAGSTWATSRRQKTRMSL